MYLDGPLVHPAPGAGPGRIPPRRIGSTSRASTPRSWTRCWGSGTRGRTGGSTSSAVFAVPRPSTDLVDRGSAAVAFAMHPVSVEDLMGIADAGGIMPPKSTWFEPKLRDGLLSHLI